MPDTFPGTTDPAEFAAVDAVALSVACAEVSRRASLRACDLRVICDSLRHLAVTVAEDVDSADADLVRDALAAWALAVQLRGMAGLPVDWPGMTPLDVLTGRADRLGEG